MCNRTQRNHRPLPPPGSLSSSRSRRAYPPLAPSSADAKPQIISVSAKLPACQGTRWNATHRAVASASGETPAHCRHTGPQGPSRGSPSIEGLQTLLAPPQSVKTRWRLSYRLRYLAGSRPPRESASCCDLSTTTRLRYHGFGLLSTRLPNSFANVRRRCFQSCRFCSRFRGTFAQPINDAIRICGCQEVVT